MKSFGRFSGWSLRQVIAPRPSCPMSGFRSGQLCVPLSAAHILLLSFAQINRLLRKLQRAQLTGDFKLNLCVAAATGRKRKGEVEVEE